MISKFFKFVRDLLSSTPVEENVAPYKVEPAKVQEPVAQPAPVKKEEVAVAAEPVQEKKPVNRKRRYVKKKPAVPAVVQEQPKKVEQPLSPPSAKQIKKKTAIRPKSK